MDKVASDTAEINQNPIEIEKCTSKGCEMAGINNLENENPKQAYEYAVSIPIHEFHHNNYKALINIE